MDYADAYIKVHQMLREAYNAANEKRYDQAEEFGLLLVAASQALLQDIRNKKN
jgi:hypothetical protein